MDNNEKGGQEKRVFFVTGIGLVTEGQIVDIPEHRRVLSSGGIEIDTDWCNSTKGIVSVRHLVPYDIAVVQCMNANSSDPNVEQCTWRREGKPVA